MPRFLTPCNLNIILLEVVFEIPGAILAFSNNLSSFNVNVILNKFNLNELLHNTMLTSVNIVSVLTRFSMCLHALIVETLVVVLLCKQS